ncbi:MAG TPA: tetratricopeptide repeat protein [Ktedonobacteraceae bacterium]|nr:tetratricopeptide repeat protein [Ktedonobacteraceae bacterium]
MLETIREYAHECLVASGEENITCQAHATYYLMLAEQSETELGGPGQMVWLERLEREHDNLLAAQRWSIERGEKQSGAEAAYAMEIALRLAGALRRFWQMHGYLNEGQTFLERLLTASQGIVVSTRARAKALIAAATLAAVQNDYDHVESYARQSLALFRELGDQPNIALSLYLLSVVPLMKGDNATARSLSEEALVLFRQMGDKERIAWSLSTLGLIDSQEGKHDIAQMRFEESLSVHRELGDRRGIAASLLRLAQDLFVSQRNTLPVEAASSRPAALHRPSTPGLRKQDRIRSLLEEALALYRQLGDKDGIANAYSLSGQLALYSGDATTARALLQESLEMYREMGHRRGIGESLARLARALTAQNEYAAAHFLYEESLAIARQLNHSWLIAFCLEGLAVEAVQNKEFLWAAQLLGLAEHLRQSINFPLPPVESTGHERLLAIIRSGLNPDIFAVARARGGASTVEQVIGAREQDVLLDSSGDVGTRLIASGLDTSPSLVSSAEDSPSLTYPAGLTAREVEVLRLVARGLTNSEIARELGLSEKTIAHHLTHIFNKTSSDNRAAAVAFAFHHGLA